MTKSTNLFSGYYNFTIKNIPKIIKYRIQSFKMMYERIKYGICTWDCYNLNDYLDSVVYNGIKEYSEKTDTYPAHMSSKEWEKTLNKIVNYYEIVINSYEDDIYDIDIGEDKNFKDIVNYLIEQDKKIAEKRSEGMQLLLKYWDNLYL